MTAVRFVSWFAGIGGFDLGLTHAGFECVGACEIDAFARSVYAARLGAKPFFAEDINGVKAEEIPASDLWCGGFPCQDISSAGKRAGIAAGKRSGLIWKLLDLWDACPRERGGPEWLLLENVPGLLSGRDDANNTAYGATEGRLLGEPIRDVAWMAIILGALADRGLRWSYRVLDAQHFGVPQRRKRVFILARRARDGVHPGEVLLEPESGLWDSPTRGKAGARASAGAPGGAGVVGALAGHSDGAGYRLGGDEAAAGHLIAHAIKARDAKGVSQRESDTTLIVASTLTSGGHPNSNAPGRRREDDENLVVANTISASAGHHGHSSPRGDGSDNLVVFQNYADLFTDANRTKALRHGHGSGTPMVAFYSNLGSQGGGIEHDVSPALKTPASGGGNIVGVLVPKEPIVLNMQGSKGNSITTQDGTSPTLNAMHGHDVHAVLVVNGNSTPEVSRDVAMPLRANDGSGNRQAILQQAPIPFDLAQITHPANRTRCDPGATNGCLAATGQPMVAVDTVFPTLRGFGHGWQGQHNDDAAKAMMVRRLTPVECSRLQGFPDNWCAIPGSTDSKIYKALGNAVAVPCIRWIGERLMKAISADASQYKDGLWT